MRRLKKTASLFGLFVTCAGLAADAGAQSISGLLTNAAQVRNLKATEAAQAVPVHLRGVVIDQSSPRDQAVILADETAGIYLRADKNLLQNCRRNDVLDIVGVSDPGQFAPIVVVKAVRKLGTAPLPAPRPVSYQELITGAPDGQWVEISGVVRRSLVPATGIWRLYLAANGGICVCAGAAPPPIHAGAGRRRGAEVQAVCLYQFNKTRLVLRPLVQVREGMMVQVENPAGADTYTAPLVSADSLLQFSPDRALGHRIHVHGVVTHGQPGSMVWIRDGNSGLRIQSQQQENLRPGDEIEVLGFPAYGSSPPLLQDALFRKTGATQPPSPRSCTATNAPAFEDDLISVEAVISDVQPVLEGTAVTLNSSGTVFKAQLLESSPVYTGIPDWGAWQPSARGGHLLGGPR